ncbi:hypothetical protein KQX54_020738 [Cotesia glomerata]|uniref:Uncharacterized protein n=1 Tax=Cotesia glomerata TaxID=32391 RepID=A0AAV7IHZ7_COTGL|nr:hypothetical protein KQX54_020738 [Cotesia glomerata]
MQFNVLRRKARSASPFPYGITIAITAGNIYKSSGKKRKGTYKELVEQNVEQGWEEVQERRPNYGTSEFHSAESHPFCFPGPEFDRKIIRGWWRGESRIGSGARHLAKRK